ncbi:MAG: hypothetical protein FJY97_14185 [candidate division Zixibacteria bacterium]|nr:hypothetical protein [candidate division Zixibacteria bacterium]
MDLYSAILAIATCLMALALTVLSYRYRRDIERRKATEKGLLSREHEYRALLSSAERQTQELKLLDQVRTAMAREVDLPVMNKAVVEAIADTFGYTQVSLYLLEDDTLVMQHQVGYETFIERIPINQGVSGRTVRTEPQPCSAMYAPTRRF